MTSKRTGIIVIGLLALATSAVIVLKRFRSAMAVPPPAAVRETQAVGNVFEYEIVGEYPHDADAYTQGLIYLDGFLYESTGITGRSSVRKVRLETGETLQQRAVDPRDFGEGLTEWRGRLVQDSTKERQCADMAPPYIFRGRQTTLWRQRRRDLRHCVSRTTIEFHVSRRRMGPHS